MRRVAVVGGPGSGKSTLAREIARSIGAPHIELDALWWGPGWQSVPLEAFQRAVTDAVAADAWVVDGNYIDEVALSIVWPAADALVWLDIPRRVAVLRTLRRSFMRAAFRTDLWGTNRQGFSVLSPGSVVRLIKRWPGYSERVAAGLAGATSGELTVVQIRTSRDLKVWRQQLAPE